MPVYLPVQQRKLPEMVYNFSGLKQCFVLEENAYLEYMPEATIPCRHSRYITDTDIEIDPTATLFYSEIYREEGNITEKGNCSNTTCCRFVHGPTDRRYASVP